MHISASRGFEHGEGGSTSSCGTSYHTRSRSPRYMATPTAAALAEALASGEFAQIAPLCDAAELEAGGLSAPDWPHALHLLGHVVNNDLDAARLVWKRTPAGAKEGNAELAAAWALLQALWTSDYPAVGAALASPAWSPAAAPVVAAIGTAHRARTLRLLSTSYSTISLAQTAVYLALPEPAAADAVREAGWSALEGAPAGWLRVAPPAPTREDAAAAVDLQKLVEFAAHMS